MNKAVIVALDFSDINEVKSFLSQFKTPIYVKVGMELFYSNHVAIFKMIRELGHKIFFDIKSHDIATTVAKAMTVINEFDVDMVNVHALGGFEMMKQARLALKPDILLIAVTQLTSSDKLMINEELQIAGEVEDSVMHLASLAKKAGLDGVVCSCLEVKKVKEVLGNDFLCVTPGIRRAGSLTHEQKRVVTPSEAGVIGSDFIVVGRDITQNEDPVGSYEMIRGSFLNEY